MVIKEYINKKGKKTYYFTVYLGIDPISGKKVTTSRRGFKTIKEARSALANLQIEFDQGLNSLGAPIMTYKELYELWIPLYKETVKESTYNTTTGIFERHILPTFGNLRIDKITPVHCQKFVNEKSLNFVKFKEFFNNAKRVMDYAYKLNLIKDNPFSRVIIPKSKRNETTIKYISKETLNILLEGFKAEGLTLWYAYFRLLAYTGLRKAEGLALNWSDIDFANNTITVSKTLTLGIGNHLMLSDSPKTESSNRTIAVDPETLSILKNWRLKQMPINKKVFTNKSGGYINLPKPGQMLDKITALYGLPKITVHMLRHTHTSLLFEAGVPMKAVQERLGHSTIKTTMDIYTHISKHVEEESIDTFVKYMQN